MSSPLLARDVMVTHLVSALPDSEVLGAMQLMLKKKVTGAPVLDHSRHYLGVFSEKSSLRVLAEWLCDGSPEGLEVPIAGQLMSGRPLMLHPNDDVIEAIGRLLKYRISGVPIVDDEGRFQGVFSEKTSMEVILQSSFDQVPSGPVRGFANADEGRKIVPAMPLTDVIKIFLETPYRRLVVVDQERVIGQVSRRDAMRAGLRTLEKKGLLLESRGRVENSMDRRARTIGPDLDLLSVAQIFLQTNYRRLPVLDEGGDAGQRELLGQLSRRDVLAAFHGSLAPAKDHKQSLLYLSSINRQEDISLS